MQIATNALTPYAAETIGKTFGQNGSHPNEAAQLFSHALLAGIAAVGNGGHFGAGAAAGAGAEAAAKAITIGLYGEEAAANPNSLSEEQKSNIRDLSAAVGALVGGIGGDSALNAQLGGVLGQNAVENNYLSLKDVNDLRAELRRAKTEEEKERIFEKYRKKGESKSQALRESCRGKGDECHLNAIAELRNTNQAAATIVNNGLLLSLTESGRTDLSAWGLALDSNLPDLSYHEGQLSGGAKLLDTGVKLSPVVVAAATAGGSKAAQALAGKKTPASLANNRQPSVVDGEMTGGNKSLKFITSDGKANSVSGRNLTDQLTSQMSKPIVKDPTLRQIVNDLYRDNAKIGSGSTADAVRYERRTNSKVGGREHSEKAQNYSVALERWLIKNPDASFSDRSTALNVLRDLQNSLKGK